MSEWGTSPFPIWHPPLSINNLAEGRGKHWALGKTVIVQRKLFPRCKELWGIKLCFGSSLGGGNEFEWVGQLTAMRVSEKNTIISRGRHTKPDSPSHHTAPSKTATWHPIPVDLPGWWPGHQDTRSGSRPVWLPGLYIATQGGLAGAICNLSFPGAQKYSLVWPSETPLGAIDRC